MRGKFSYQVSKERVEKEWNNDPDRFYVHQLDVKVTAFNISIVIPLLFNALFLNQSTTFFQDNAARWRDIVIQLSSMISVFICMQNIKCRT